jgi:hypothetical protein
MAAVFEGNDISSNADQRSLEFFRFAGTEPVRGSRPRRSSQLRTAGLPEISAAAAAGTRLSNNKLD